MAGIPAGSPQAEGPGEVSRQSWAGMWQDSHTEQDPCQPPGDPGGVFVAG